jgi:hypothetical protein
VSSMANRRDRPGSSDLAGWPDAVRPVLERAITVEYASLTRAGQPIMVPVTPYVSPTGRTLDVSTGLTYPAKAERARRNPMVCLLFADHLGSGLTDPPVVLVQGLAAVRDGDLQANTDRYLREAMAKTPAAYQDTPRFVIRRLDWYFARIWVEVTPLRIWWWPSNALEQQPGQWAAPAEVPAPASDPAPPGKQPPAWLEAPTDWRSTARRVVTDLDQLHDLGWVDIDGFPLAVPVLHADVVADGFRLHLGTHLPGVPEGPACLTFHTHPASFTGQENHSFLGQVSAVSEHHEFRVERLLADVSLAGNRLTRPLGFLAKGRRLRPRLVREAARRGQPVPTVRLPPS